MDFKKGQKLKDWQCANPVVYKNIIEFKNLIIFNIEELNTFFDGKGNQIKTWGRKEGVKIKDPHFIGTKGSTTMHTDPAYPRYTHQLKLYVDDDIHTIGLNGEKTELKRGLFYILDTHSPHQVISKNKNGLNISISLDSDEILSPDEVIPILLSYNNYKLRYNDSLFK